ncbi:MAG: Xaa-Pro peptidase family protein [Planctomycetota bacterium]|nr:Xaa-Pro peptidase family protein [Planctomycetota bacterium]
MSLSRHLQTLSIPTLGLLLLSADTVTSQEPPATLTKEFFRGRRQALMELVKQGTEEGRRSVIVLRGGTQGPEMAPFYQDHDFWYLSGVAEEDVAMILLPEEGKEILLVPPFNRFTATWNGKRLAPGERSVAQTGFAEVGNSRQLSQKIADLLGSSQGRPLVWTFLRPQPARTSTPSAASGAASRRSRDRLDGRPTREKAFQDALEEKFPEIEIKDVTPFIGELRAVKTTEEIASIKAATEIACEGIAEAMKSVEPGVYEYQLQAAARYVFTRMGAGEDAYAAIVGSGPNGCVLHYNANRKRTEAGELVVMDYAPTVNGYTSDVTRTFPVSGKFTKEQRKLVQDVHDVQKELIDRVKPGARLSQLGALCGKLLRAKGYSSDHGPCHHVGLAVHDKQGDILEPGMLITVEPGAYLRDKGMGCRIEDVVLVTEDGCVKLSGHLPSKPEEIERLMAKDGLQSRSFGLGR